MLKYNIERYINCKKSFSFTVSAIKHALNSLKNGDARFSREARVSAVNGGDARVSAVNGGDAQVSAVNSGEARVSADAFNSPLQ